MALSTTPLVIVLRDGYPVSPGHTLIVPRRHFASFFGATRPRLPGVGDTRCAVAMEVGLRASAKALGCPPNPTAAAQDFDP
jgi:diadenosine tetraphosphate (Ap4A) HIT family hydrolase